MTSASLILTRRKFMLVSAAAVAASLLMDLSGPVPGAETVEEVTADEKGSIDHVDPKCRGCQVCKIFFSNCLALNHRHCWCELGV